MFSKITFQNKTFSNSYNLITVLLHTCKQEVCKEVTICVEEKAEIDVMVNMTQ